MSKYPQANCKHCNDECSSWWMYQAGIAKEDYPLCVPCMKKISEDLYSNMIKYILKYE